MSVLRLFLFWLLAVAVPLQGYAASSMLFCTGQPSRLAQAQAHEHAPAGARQHAHAGEAALPAVEAALAGSPHSLASVHDCSVCAACHAVALTQAAGVPHIAAAPGTGAEPAPVAVPTRPLRLPEKPPRA